MKKTRKALHRGGNASTLTATAKPTRQSAEEKLNQREIPRILEERLGAPYARQRLASEHQHEGQLFGGGINFFHIENWYSVHSVIRTLLKASGLFWRGVRNSADIQVRHHRIRHKMIPESFQGFTILQLSDL